jgi:hypothetical protein
MRRRISANSILGTATSAIGKMMEIQLEAAVESEVQRAVLRLTHWMLHAGHQRSSKSPSLDLAY